MALINPPELTSCLKNQTFKNRRWRTAAILKIVECDTSATVWPILVKFGMAMHIVCLPIWRSTKDLKILKSKMADGGHLEYKKSRYLQNRLADYDEILLTSCSKIKLWKIQDARWPSFDNCLMRYLSNHLTDCDAVCMVMHISRSDPIGNQKLKI